MIKPREDRIEHVTADVSMTSTVEPLMATLELRGKREIQAVTKLSTLVLVPSPTYVQRKERVFLYVRLRVRVKSIAKKSKRSCESPMEGAILV
jgi:hypothetical protein